MWVYDVSIQNCLYESFSSPLFSFYIFIPTFVWGQCGQVG